MAIDIEFNESGDVLVARLTDSFSPRADEIADKTIAQKCIDDEKTKVLIDYRAVEGQPLPLDSFHSGDELSQRGFTRNIKMAFLDRIEFISANEFYELVATNRGFQLRHFYNEAEAMEWLGS